MQYDNVNESELNCAAFKSRLDAVLDSRRSPRLDLPLRAHANRCPACAEWLAAQTTLLDKLQNSERIELPSDFSVRVVQAMEIETVQHRQRRLRQIISLALAASLLIGVFAWRGSRPQGVARLPVAAESPKIPAGVLERMNEVTEDFKPVSGSVYTALNAIWLAQRLL